LPGQLVVVMLVSLRYGKIFIPAENYITNCYSSLRHPLHELSYQQGLKLGNPILLNI